MLCPLERVKAVTFPASRRIRPCLRLLASTPHKATFSWRFMLSSTCSTRSRFKSGTSSMWTVSSVQQISCPSWACRQSRNLPHWQTGAVDRTKQLHQLQVSKVVLVIISWLILLILLKMWSEEGVEQMPASSVRRNYDFSDERRTKRYLYSCTSRCVMWLLLFAQKQILRVCYIACCWRMGRMVPR
ncbi:hypothetical protein K402DRAFT_172868 [Aulographum hederae CBS 113979]|uniref:Uncharacterized protein n=1 Tax=Aulographum hederae CBS 113979 TaxID=1176131 RepID=A0A6G1HDT8_9PEZI|nr:hypothetical protein K402DRAFT_172868 [Aulographum hederae CBS 113979]